MSTLKDVVDRLRAEGQLVRNTGTNSIKSVKVELQQISSNIVDQHSSIKDTFGLLKNWYEEEKTRIALNSVSGAPTPPTPPTPTPPTPGPTGQPAGAGSGFGAGLGGNLLRAGGGALAGAGMLGLALPAFFGGLMAGDMGLDWLSQFGSGFDFDNLKAAVIGFTDIISGIDDRSLVTLGAIMGVSAVGGVKAAAGLGTMGFAISAFLGGLLAGDALFSGVTALGGNLEFNGMKAALTGFSDMILSIDEESLKFLGVLLAGSAVAGLVGRDPFGPAKALGSMGLAISGFLGGLLAGDALFEGVSALGGSLDFGSMRQVLAGFSESIGALSPEAAAALAAIIGASGVAGVFGGGVKSALGMAAIMTGIGAGVSGLMIGLTAGEIATSWLSDAAGMDSGGLVSAFQLFNDSIGALSPTAATALAAIIGASGVVGAFGGIGVAAGAGAGIFAIMTGIGAGIAGLMIGLAAGEVGVSWIQQFTGQGEGIAGIFETFNNSILAITPEAIERLKSLSDIGGLDIAGAMTGLSAGMVALFGAGGLGQLTEGIKQVALDAIDWLFGTNYGDTNKSTIQFLVDSLEPIKSLDAGLVSKMDEFGGAVERFAQSFATLGQISTENAAANLTKMVRDIGGVLELLPHLMTGEPYDPRSGLNKFMQDLFGNQSDIITFGPGLNNIDFSKLEELSRAINAIRNALQGTELEPMLMTPPGGLNGGGGNTTLGGGAGVDILSTTTSMGAVSAVQAAALQASSAPMVVVNAPTVAPVTTNVRGGTTNNTMRATVMGPAGSNAGLAGFAN